LVIYSFPLGETLQQITLIDCFSILDKVYLVMSSNLVIRSPLRTVTF
jgi:hypothetical protein